MAGILKLGGVPLATHSDSTAKVSLDTNVQFPAGHVIQTVTKAATVTATESSGSNTVKSSDFFNKSITAKGNNSIFVIHAFIL